MKNIHICTLLIILTSSIYSSPGNYIDIKKSRWIIAEPGLRMRENPDLKAKHIMTIPYLKKVLLIKEIGNEIEISGEKGKWSQIEYQGKTGWVFGGFLAISKINFNKTDYSNNDILFVIDHPQSFRQNEYYQKTKFVIYKNLNVELCQLKSKKLENNKEEITIINKSIIKYESQNKNNFVKIDFKFNPVEDHIIGNINLYSNKRITKISSFTFKRSGMESVQSTFIEEPIFFSPEGNLFFWTYIYYESMSHHIYNIKTKKQKNIFSKVYFTKNEKYFISTSTDERTGFNIKAYNSNDLSVKRDLQLKGYSFIDNSAIGNSDYDYNPVYNSKNNSFKYALFNENKYYEKSKNNKNINIHGHIEWFIYNFDSNTIKKSK